MRNFLAVVPPVALALAACSDMPTAAPGPQYNHVTGKSSVVEPSLNAGNFAIEDVQEICYAAFGEDALTQLEGFTALVGFKIDPLGANYDVNWLNGGLSVQSSGDGIHLNWTALNSDVQVLGVVVKGGNNYHFYDYINGPYVGGSNLFPVGTDSWLHSPTVLQRKKLITPEISHINFCVNQDREDTGCTPGYWRNHQDRWLGYAPGDDFDATFGVNAFDPDITLGTAIALGSGGINALARHAVAALLNATGGIPNADGTTVSYPYTEAQVIQMVQDAIANGTIEATKNLFQAANELGCPLAGTPAT